MNQQRKRVVVVGGGFGGLAVAKSLADEDVDVLLIDKRNHHVFQPLLYQVATAMLSPAQIAHPLRNVFKRQKNIKVLLGNACEVDRKKKLLHIRKSNQSFTFDYLVIATGARHSYFGHPEWEEWALGLKSVKDALMIRERLLYSFEKAERTRIDEKKRRFSTVVIVGAGPTGVEMAGAIAELTRHTLRGEFKSFDPRSTRIILIEGGPQVLGRYDAGLSKKALKDLEDLGVECRLNTMVTNIGSDGVQLGEEFIETENIIWAAGNMASSFVATVTDDVNRVGQANVNADFSIKEDSNIFCIGDCAYLEDGRGVMVPAVAQGAMQAGRFVARQIKNDLRGRKRDVFQYKDKGSMATIGRSRAIAQLPHMKFSGFIAWVLWGVIHVMFLVDFKNRVGVFIDWIYSYFTDRRTVRLINIYREK